MASTPGSASMGPQSASVTPQIPIIIKRPGAAGAGVPSAGVARIPGVHPSTRYGQQVVSTGIPSLDAYLGNGFPVNSIVIIKDTFPSHYADMILKCFIAEGATYNHHIFVKSGGSASSGTFANQLPSLVAKQESEKSSSRTSTDADDMRIAWRYKDASPLPTTLSTRGLGTTAASKGQQRLSSKFEFTKKSTATELGGKHVTTQDDIDVEQDPSTVNFESTGDAQSLLSQIVTLAKDFDSTENRKPSNFLRIALSHCEHELSPKCMRSLRALVRHTNSCAVLTVSDLRLNPTQSFDLEHFADYVMEVQGIVDDVKKKQFGDNIDGICEIKKLDSINSNKPMPKPKDLGFSFRKKRIIFQELHLQPEDDTTAQRETSKSKTVSASVLPQESAGCGGGLAAKGKSIDF